MSRDALPLDGRAFIVTGAGAGIGRATALRITDLGGAALIVDLDEGALRETGKGIQDRGGRSAQLAEDVTDPDHPARAVTACVDAFGRIDGCVPCAGRILIRAIRDVRREEWESLLTLNLTTVFFTAREVAERIRSDQHAGAMVLISSTSAHGARPNNVDYGVSKIGVDHVTRTLAAEYAADGIRVNAVSPGVVDTPMWQQIDVDRGAHLGLEPGELTRKMVETIPMHRLCPPEELGGVIARLLTDEFAYATGQVFEVDGGFKLTNP